MKGRQIVFDRIGGRRAAALVVDGVLEDLLIEPPDDIPLPGAIYRAQVMRPMKGQGGAFVRLHPRERTGFLRQAKGMREGAHVLVQVTGFADPGKAPPVTTRLLFKSRYCILTPDAPGLNISRTIKDEEARLHLREVAEAADLPATFGLILRSAAAEAAADDIADDIAAMAELAEKVVNDAAGAETDLLLEGPGPEDLAWMEWSDPSAAAEVSADFEACGVWEAIEETRRPEVDLPNGARMFIEPTRALVAVDIDTGGVAGAAAGLKTNISAARALPRALRLRGLGGQIAIDTAPMPKKDRRAFEQVLKAAFRSDAIDTALVGWTPLGHYELQRKRERPPLSECLP